MDAHDRVESIRGLAARLTALSTIHRLRLWEKDHGDGREYALCVCGHESRSRAELDEHQLDTFTAALDRVLIEHGWNPPAPPAPTQDPDR